MKYNPLDELKRFRQWDSRTPGHSEYGLTPGVETSTGPLGQGFANGVGLALAQRFLAAHFNRPGWPLVDHYTYGLVSDGDLMEGVAAEAASLAGHLGLGKLIYLYDQNGISLAGSTALTFSEDVMALHGGIIAYGATFFVFSDYMRPPIRLAALTNLGVKYVFTHDSIAVGEDGPTHQPVEHLAALRAILRLVVMRSADANEVTWAWRVALTERDRPVALVLSRQDLPIFDRDGLASAEGVTRGAYVLAEAPGESSTPPDLVLLSSGSEVALCLAAREQLVARGIRTRVVSMPGWELFDEQPMDYRATVLGPLGTPRLAVEAGVCQGWSRYTGERGAMLGIQRFGASAPGGEVLRHYGFTVENVVTRALWTPFWDDEYDPCLHQRPAHP